jgi:large subunit ribosomal protein L24
MTLQTKKQLKAKLHVGDSVIVIAGKDKGHRGELIRIERKERGHVMVSGAQIVTRHVKPNPSKNQEGGRVQSESWIDISNVAILNPQTNKADRVGYKFIGEDNKKKVRCYKSTGELIDAKE